MIVGFVGLVKFEFVWFVFGICGNCVLAGIVRTVLSDLCLILNCTSMLLDFSLIPKMRVSALRHGTYPAALAVVVVVVARPKDLQTQMPSRSRRSQVPSLADLRNLGMA